MTLTIFTGAAAGGGGGGGGGGGATRKLVNCVFGSVSVKIKGMITKTTTSSVWIMKETKTEALLRVVFPPSTKVCSNIWGKTSLASQAAGRPPPGPWHHL